MAKGSEACNYSWVDYKLEQVNGNPAPKNYIALDTEQRQIIVNPKVNPEQELEVFMITLSALYTDGTLSGKTDAFKLTVKKK